jgi:hypothetical protein
MPGDNEGTETSTVTTGALDEPGLYRRQLLTAVVGWILTALLIYWLISSADELALEVTVFLVSVSVVIAIVGIGAGVDFFRGQRLASKAPNQVPPPVGISDDALGRPTSVPSEPRELVGELTIEIIDGVRTFERVDN